MGVQGFPVHRFREYRTAEPTIIMEPGGDGYAVGLAVPSVCSWCAGERGDPVHRDLGRTVTPTHPGMVPKPAATVELERSALVERIKKGHEGVEFVPIGGADVRAERGTA